MCGINGWFNISGTVSGDPATLIQKMNRRLVHRGPDDEGTWHSPDGRVYFGHRRLSIIDLSTTGHQPMKSEKGTVIVFNGEIYNYRELQDQFFRDTPLKSSSDTEILILLYERFGEKCLDYLNGMFAFAIWDPEKEMLFLGRDRAGKKPLYYVLDNGVFAFSSEIKALLELPFVKRELDEEALYHFLTFNLLPSPFTLFKGIHKMPAAGKMFVDKRGLRDAGLYWEVKYTDLTRMNEDEITGQILQGLRRSVSYRMVSDVPVGAFLSGGVDSSSIVALMAERSTYPVKTYSIGFEGQPNYDELKYAAQIAKQFKTDHHETIIKPSDITNFLPNIVDIFDEPMADATCIPIYFLSKKARENGTIVVLTGDGSDEIFSGYSNWMKYIRLYPYYKAYNHFPGFLKRFAAYTYGKFGDSSAVYEMFQRAANKEEFFWGGAKSFKESTKRKFLSDEFNKKSSHFNSYSIIQDLKWRYEEAVTGFPDDGVIDWMCYLGFHFTVPHYYLYRMDRLGMAHSIEIRSPFLDYQFVNLALSVPGQWKIKNGEPKYILKKALGNLLPAETLYRKKQGFNVPLREWAGEMLLDYLEHNLKGFCNRHEQFRYEGLKQQVERFRKGDKQVTNTLWTTYFLMNWFDKWLP